MTTRIDPGVARIVVAAVYDRRSMNQITPAVIDRRHNSAPEHFIK